MDIVLTDLTIDGSEFKALMHAPKNGFFYVINRETGELISADAFAENTWATHVDLETGRPVEVLGARYENGFARVSPTPWGAHNWHAMSYNPAIGLTYIPTMHLSATFSDAGIDHESWQSSTFYQGDGIGVAWELEEDPGSVMSTLQAWDPVRREAVWEIPLGGMWNAGTMTTAGNLVFQGRASGDLVAYNARSGETLWTFNVGSGISAPPVTYAMEGRQYVAILVGWGGGVAGLGGFTEVRQGWAYGVHPRRLISFSLEGGVELPESPPPTIPEPIDLDFEVDLALAQQGEAEYSQCVSCHGFGAVSTGMAPDLRASAIVGSDTAFEAVVRDGSLIGNGMPVFADMTDDELLSLSHCIRQQAQHSPGDDNLDVTFLK